MGEWDLMKAVNLRQTEARTIKADLLEQDIIVPSDTGKNKYEYKYGANELDMSGFEKIKALRYKELKDIIDYAENTDCRMARLCRYLDDETVEKCDKCDNDQDGQKNMEQPLYGKRRLICSEMIISRKLRLQTNPAVLLTGLQPHTTDIQKLAKSYIKANMKTEAIFPTFSWIYALKRIKKHLAVSFLI